LGNIGGGVSTILFFGMFALPNIDWVPAFIWLLTAIAVSGIMMRRG